MHARREMPPPGRGPAERGAGGRPRADGPLRDRRGRSRPRPTSSPVTVADRQSEEIILEGWRASRRAFRSSPRRQCRPGRIPTIDGAFFLVDPLDGTKGFIKGSAEFTINIGLIEARRPVFGLVYAPALADFYVTLGPDEAVDAHARAASRRSTSLADCGLTAVCARRVPDPHALARADQPVAPQPRDRSASSTATTWSSGGRCRPRSNSA